MMPYLIQQYKHMDWANQNLIAVLRQEGDAPAEAVGLMGHIVSAEHIWLSRIGGQREILSPWSKLTLSECEEYAAANSTGYLKIVRQLGESQLENIISFKLTNGKPMSSRLGNILCHVVLHGAHHRGQVSRIIAQHGIEPPAIDYILYSIRHSNQGPQAGS